MACDTNKKGRDSLRLELPHMCTPSLMHAWKLQGNFRFSGVGNTTRAESDFTISTTPSNIAVIVAQHLAIHSSRI
jgi:hypothetical protein